MRVKSIVLGSAVVLVLAAACSKPSEEAAPATATPAETAAAGAAPAASPSPAASPAAPAGSTAPAQETVIASQETNWSGVVAEVTEFRRKGNTLTARVRLRNQSGAESEPDIKYSEVYVMDLAAAKKYKVLQDEAGSYIAALRSGWTDRWYEKLGPGESQMIWIKFPAPPAEVKSITLQLPGAPPFEDLAIQDS